MRARSRKHCEFKDQRHWLCRSCGEQIRVIRQRCDLGAIDSVKGPYRRAFTIMNPDGSPHHCEPKVKVYTKEEIAEFERERK